MNFNEYQTEVARTSKNGVNKIGEMLNYALGIGGEAGEVMELIKKHIFHGKPLDTIHLTEEIGDVLWYLAALALTLDINFDLIARRNIEKLRERYPDGFKIAKGKR